MAELPNLLNLKIGALRLKYQSIETELLAWQKLTAEGQPLEKHNSQVRRISSGLAGMIEVVGAEIEKLVGLDLATFFPQARRAEFLVLEIHRTWHYFRQKLTTRQAPPYNRLLEALDEFVWTCYRPVVEVAILPRQNGTPAIDPAAVREPPLTFFNSNWSPAASAREETLPLEETVDSGGGRFAQEGKQLAARRLANLLVPVIGLPWSDGTFLPEALILAHEAAHLLDYDLKLSADIERNLKAGLPKTGAARFKQYWQPWSAEVFADLYGTLSLGPAFVGALMTLVAGSPSEVLNSRNDQYPTPHLRILLVLEALKSGGFLTEAAALAQTWQRTYGQPVAGKPDTYEIKDFALPDCVADVPAVVKALLDGPFTALDGSTFRKVSKVVWTKDDQSAAVRVRDAMLQTGMPLDSNGPRILLAGAQLAFQVNPAALRSNQSPAPNTKTQTDLVEKILASRRAGTRGDSNSRSGVTGSKASPAQAEADRAKGKALALALLSEFEAS